MNGDTTAESRTIAGREKKRTKRKRLKPKRGLSKNAGKTPALQCVSSKDKRRNDRVQMVAVRNMKEGTYSAGA